MLKQAYFRFISCMAATSSIMTSLNFAVTLPFRKSIEIPFQSGKLLLRNNAIDEKVFRATFLDAYHLPFFQLPENASIVDLGSNIGLTIADFKRWFPDARVIGMEMDKNNFEICCQNTGHVQKVWLENKAVWTQDGFVGYHKSDAQSFSIDNSTYNESGGEIASMSLNTLMKNYHLDKIDYLKMDIEGAEKALILDEKAEDWIRKTYCMNIELHDEAIEDKYSIALKDKLSSLGFIVFRSLRHFNALIAINNELVTAGEAE